jgi:hypothetical protein
MLDIYVCRAQAVSRRVPTAATRVRTRIKLCVGFVVDRAAPGYVFSEYLGFLANHSFHQLLDNHHHHHVSSTDGITGQ